MKLAYAILIQKGFLILYYNDQLFVCIRKLFNEELGYDVGWIQVLDYTIMFVTKRENEIWRENENQCYYLNE